MVYPLNYTWIINNKDMDKEVMACFRFLTSLKSGMSIENQDIDFVPKIPTMLSDKLSIIDITKHVIKIKSNVWSKTIYFLSNMLALPMIQRIFYNFGFFDDFYTFFF